LGDCREILPTLEPVDLVLTDPPYGMRLNTDFSKMKSRMFKGKTGGNYHGPVVGDDRDFDPRPFFEIIKTREQFWFGADYYADKLPKGGSWMIWDKRLSESADKMWGSCFEVIWSMSRHKRVIFRVKWAGIFGMEKQDIKSRIHPTQKPLNLIKKMISKYSQQNETILDPFMGSGTTLRAAKDLGRKAIGIEIEEKYCEIAAKRLAQEVFSFA
jgi:DNA modification methylase